MPRRDITHWTDDDATAKLLATPTEEPAMTASYPSAAAEAFCRQHRSGDPIVLPNAWDPGSAVLMAEAGFPVIATTSAGIAYAHGCADGERLGRAGMLDAVAAIVRRSKVPVTADLEAGYGPSPSDVAETVRQAIGTGLIGCNIEDSDPATKRLIALDDAVERIRAGRTAADKLGVPFALNARTDPYLIAGGDAEANFAEGVRRSNAYLAAGATCAYVPGPADAETVGRLVAAIDGPLNILGARAGRPGLPLAELQRLGVRRVSIGGSLALTVYTHVRGVLAGIRERGDLDYAGGAMTNRAMDLLMGAASR
jgi:2-methylisocitrate lyase-like PEP mutase family enzyme